MYGGGHPAVAKAEETPGVGIVVGGGIAGHGDGQALLGGVGALAAGPEELDPSGLQSVSVGLVHLVTVATEIRHGEIVYAIAAAAHEMGVLLICELVAIEGAAEIELPYVSLLYENGEIAIDVSQAHRGKLLAQLVVEPGCGRVFFGGAQELEHAAALFASTQFLRHVYMLSTTVTIVNL
jgi:hypothetical protein